jgi:hypothetical protein
VSKATTTTREGVIVSTNTCETAIADAIAEDLHIMRLSGAAGIKDIERFLGAVKSIMAHMDTLHPTLGLGHAAALISPMAWGDICGL